jgi:microcystin degradation protein MlrC
VVLADTQDNPGAGGNGDTTGLLKTCSTGPATHAGHADRPGVGATRA